MCLTLQEPAPLESEVTDSTSKSTAAADKQSTASEKCECPAEYKIDIACQCYDVPETTKPESSSSRDIKESSKSTSATKSTGSSIKSSDPSNLSQKSIRSYARPISIASNRFSTIDCQCKIDLPKYQCICMNESNTSRTGKRFSKIYIKI